MSWQSDLIYRTQNGDAWHLLWETPGARILVRHAANPASGGRVTDLPVEDSLATDGVGPEHRALRELLAELARPGRPERWSRPGNGHEAGRGPHARTRPLRTVHRPGTAMMADDAETTRSDGDGPMTPILPAHIEDTVAAIAKVHSDHHLQSGRVQRLVERVTGWIGRPRFIAGMTVAVVLWIGGNAAATLAGLKAWDGPPFAWLEGAVSLLALYVTMLILATRPCTTTMETWRACSAPARRRPPRSWPTGPWRAPGRRRSAPCGRPRTRTLAKSTFIANMGHELRTPLSAIIGYSEMMIEEADEGADGTFQAPDMRKVENNARHLLGLINDVLDLSKVESGKMEVYAEQFDVRGMIGNVAATVSGLLDKKGNVLKQEIAPGVSSKPGCTDIPVVVLMARELSRDDRMRLRGAEMREAGETFAGHGVMCVDSAAGEVVWFWFDSHGHLPLEPARAPGTVTSWSCASRRRVGPDAPASRSMATFWPTTSKARCTGSPGSRRSSPAATNDSRSDLSYPKGESAT